MMEHGIGCCHNIERAILFYEKAIESDESANSDALFNLANIFCRTDHELVYCDIPRAVGLYKAAAEMNHNSAQTTPGDLYQSGVDRHLNADSARAMEWYRKAVDIV